MKTTLICIYCNKPIHFKINKKAFNEITTTLVDTVSCNNCHVDYSIVAALSDKKLVFAVYAITFYIRLNAYLVWIVKNEYATFFIGNASIELPNILNHLFKPVKDIRRKYSKLIPFS